MSKEQSALVFIELAVFKGIEAPDEPEHGQVADKGAHFKVYARGDADALALAVLEHLGNFFNIDVSADDLKGQGMTITERRIQ